VKRFLLPLFVLMVGCGGESASQDQLDELSQTVSAQRELISTLQQSLAALEGEVSDLQADVDKKTTGLEQGALERSRLHSEFLAGMDRAESQARVLLEQAREQHEERYQELYVTGERDLLAERERRKARDEELARGTLRIEELTRELDKTSHQLLDHERAASEAERMWQEDRIRITDEAETRIQLARNGAEDARRQRDSAREELFMVHSLVEDLQADVVKKTEGIEKAQLERSRLQSEFMANLERAEGSANTLLEEARDRLTSLSDERGRLVGFVEELEHRARDLERNLEGRETSLELSEQRLRAEHANFEELMLEAQMLRKRSSESTGRVAELEADAIRQQSALESLSGELARTGSRLEQTSFELEGLSAEATKKSLELSEAQKQRDSANAHADEIREALQTELGQVRDDLGRQAGRAEQAEFEVASLRQEVTKKTAELGEAQKQRDSLNAEKTELHKLLRAASGSDEPEPEPENKKKKAKRPEA